MVLIGDIAIIKANDFVNIYLFSGRYEDREVYLDFEGNLPRILQTI